MKQEHSGWRGFSGSLAYIPSSGQLYEPEDSKSLMWYREEQTGQILEEGINESGAFSSWLAAATSGANYGRFMIPFYIFYSMFGFQRIGDLAWAAGDSRARGFLIGATSGRTTLNGEGLQHQDGHSHIMSSAIPCCLSYDPSFSYELAVIIQDGLRRMYEKGENLFYYITVMNENYSHPDMPSGCEEGIVKGIYLFREGLKSKRKVQLMGSGAILREVIAASDILKENFNIDSDIWSIPGINQLHRDGIDTERWNRDNPGKERKTSYLTSVMKERKGPVVISTDYIRAYPEQIRRLIPGKVSILGTDGFGRSDSRENLRSFFEVDRFYIALTAVNCLEEEGLIEKGTTEKALKIFNIVPDKKSPYRS